LQAFKYTSTSFFKKEQAQKSTCGSVNTVHNKPKNNNKELHHQRKLINILLNNLINNL